MSSPAEQFPTDPDDPDDRGHDANGAAAGGPDAGAHNAKLLNPDYALNDSALDGPRGPVLTDADASPRTIAAWEEQETNPESGVVLSVGSDQYRVPADLRRWLRLRDGTCRFPGCNRPAFRSDIDHTTSWDTTAPGTPTTSPTSAGCTTD
jgi:hypothetical protein